PDSVLAEITIQQLACRAAGKRDAVVGFEKNDGCSGQLVQRERVTKALSGLMGAVEPDEVGVQGVEDGTVACAEIAVDVVEDEALGPRGRGDAKPEAERVLETAWPQDEVVQPRAVQLAPGEEVRDLHRGEAPLIDVPVYGVLGLPDGLDRRPVEPAGEPFVTGTIEMVTGAVAR